MDPLNVLAKFEIRSFSHSWVPKEFGQSLDMPTLHFLQIFHGLLFGWTLLLFWPNLRFVALPVPEIIAIGVLGGVRTPNLGERETIGGRGWYRSKERRWVPIGSHSNFFSSFTCFRDIAAFLLQNAIFSHPTSSLPQNFPMFHWE